MQASVRTNTQPQKCKSIRNGAHQNTSLHSKDKTHINQHPYRSVRIAYVNTHQYAHNIQIRVRRPRRAIVNRCFTLLPGPAHECNRYRSSGTVNKHPNELALMHFRSLAEVMHLAMVGATAVMFQDKLPRAPSNSAKHQGEHKVC